ncbi:hypothetical protein EDC94DRAFT_632202, partial [Helicostylum pulchrum]
MYIDSIMATATEDNSDDEDEDASASQYVFLSAEAQKKFVDLLYVPAIKKVAPSYYVSNISTSYQEAISYGYSDDPKEFICSDVLRLVVTEMRDMVNSTPSLMLYKGFFISFCSFGGKQPVTTSQVALANVIAPGLINWENLDKTKVLLDIATTISSVEESPSASFFLKHTSKHDVPALYGVKREERKRLFPSALSSFGGLSV